MKETQKLVLSASQLGVKCLRKLWLISRGIESEVPEETKRIFEIGKALEPLVVEWLRREGKQVYYNEKDHRDKPDFRIPVGRGEVQGRFDAVILDEGLLVDIKTCGDRLFAELMDGKVPEQYVVQLNVYFFGVKGWGDVVDEKIRNVIRRMGVIGVHKSSGKMVLVELSPSAEVFGEAIEKAKRIFDAESFIGLEYFKDPFGCGGCYLKRICYEG